MKLSLFNTDSGFVFTDHVPPPGPKMSQPVYISWETYNHQA